MQRSSTAAIEFVGRAIEILEWGRSAWATVPKDDRGAIFEWTFLRGVKALYLNMYHKVEALCSLSKITLFTSLQAYSHEPEPKSKYSLETLYELAEEIAKDKNSLSSSTEYDPGFISSFVTYPGGNALAYVRLVFLSDSLLSHDGDAIALA